MHLRSFRVDYFHFGPLNAKSDMTENKIRYFITYNNNFNFHLHKKWSYKYFHKNQYNNRYMVCEMRDPDWKSVCKCVLVGDGGMDNVLQCSR